MPLVNTNFIAGRMNKSVDERLLPPGEYVDAVNVRLGSTETTEIGAVENSRGNTQLTTLQFGNNNLSSQAKCLGAFEDGTLETMYWFVHDPNNPVASGGVVDMVVSYNTTNNQLRYHVITYSVLNFDPEYLITGVSKIENLLFFTDGKNPPRRINVNEFYPAPPNLTTDGIQEEDISVVLKPPGFEDVVVTGETPLPAPTFTLINVAGGENYIKDRFVSFAYRYRYKNNEYSATSLFTNPAFQPGFFNFDTRNYDNAGMENAFNGVRLTFSTGSERVKQIDLLYKDSNTNSIYVIEKFKKSDYGWANDTHQEYVFTNSKIYTVLGSDELLRLYDNVPLKAQAQTIMGNRLIYGNYNDGFDIVNKAGQDISMDYTTKTITQQVRLKALPDGSLSQGIAYTINPSATTTVANSKVTFDFSDIADDLKTNTQIELDLRIEHAALNGTTAGSCWADNNNYAQAQLNIGVIIILTANYNSVYDFATSSDFENAIGTVLNTNFEPIADASDGTSLTDNFNAALVPPSTNCSFTKVLSSINDSTNQQGFAITTSPGSNLVSLQVLAMKYNSTDGSTPTDIYEYFSILTATAQYTADLDKSSLHSNRDYETGIVYLDEYARASTVLVSEFNTTFVGPDLSTNRNRIQATINNYAPYWAKKYKFVVKPSKAGYETIYTNFFYTNPFDNVTHFKLDGDNQQKVKTGDRLIVKRDTNGAISSVVETTVLDVKAQSSNFLATPEQLGEDSEQLAGLYMQLKASNFAATISDDAVIDYGEKARYSDSESSCNTIFSVSYPLFTYDADEPPATQYTNYSIPGGSVVDIRFGYHRKHSGGLSSCPKRVWIYEQQFVASEDFADFRQFWNNTPINVQTATDAEGVSYDSGRYAAAVVQPSGAAVPPNDPNVVTRGSNAECDGSFRVVVQFAQAVENDVNSPLYFVCRSGGIGCQTTFGDTDMKVFVDIRVQRANSVLVFETQPAEANDDIYYDASEAFDIVESGSVHLHQSGTDTNAGDQNQTTSQPAIVTLDFMDCYTFGNGVESYKYLDRIEGRSVVMGQRSLAVSEQDFKEANRFADMTYSGVYSSNSGINNLNEFNLGLANFKTLETAFGPIQILHARETDILTLQEDRISYVLASKNIISDSAGGGAIVSIPQVLGTQIARVEEYGISYNPESFAHYGNYFYFTDTKRSAVIELMGNSQNDRLSVISDLGMRSWFRDQFNYQLNTQKLGGYDPYMDEYVLGTNLDEVPVPVPVIQCGADFGLTNITSAVSYTYEFGNVVGTGTISYNITSGTANISILWNGVTTATGNVTGVGTLTWNKSATTPTEAVVTVTPVGTASVEIEPQCIPEVNITVIKCLLNSATEAGETIHMEYQWSDASSVSPVDSDLATFGTSESIFSAYVSQTGIRSVGTFPYDGVNLTMRMNKINFDTYDWAYPDDNFKYLSSNTLYQNNATDVAALLAAATQFPPADVTNPAPGLHTAPISNINLPVGNQYLYLIYDLRNVNAQQLCYDASSASDACCLCTFNCTSFAGTSTREDDTNLCNFARNNTYYHNGPVGLPVVGAQAFTSSNCQDAISGTVNYLPAGYYGVTATPVRKMLVGQNGVILSITNC